MAGAARRDSARRHDAPRQHAVLEARATHDRVALPGVVHTCRARVSVTTKVAPSCTHPSRSRARTGTVAILPMLLAMLHSRNADRCDRTSCTDCVGTARASGPRGDDQPARTSRKVSSRSKVPSSVLIRKTFYTSHCQFCRSGERALQYGAREWRQGRTRSGCVRPQGLETGRRAAPVSACMSRLTGPIARELPAPAAAGMRGGGRPPADMVAGRTHGSASCHGSRARYSKCTNFRLTLLPAAEFSTSTGR